jgi:hypothetical protein
LAELVDRARRGYEAEEQAPPVDPRLLRRLIAGELNREEEARVHRLV